MLFAAASVWGSTYWRLSLKAGRDPQFYQQYFEPAVMIACGHGFVIAHPPPQPLIDFLQRKTNTFSCDQVAGRLDLSTKYLYQGAWRYLMYAVGIAWRFLGISWTRMGPLFGVLFSLSIVAAYGALRLMMNRWLALGGAFLLSVSTLHVTSLPNLRDYSKAPFTLAAMFLLGLLVKLPVKRATVVALSIAYGVVLGIGYGFRTDLLINIPAILVVLFLFLEGGLRRHVMTKVLGAAAFFIAFVVAAWPILSFVNDKGGGQYHVALLGLTPQFDDALRIQPGPYDLAQAYDDLYIVKTATAYAARVHPEWHDVQYVNHEYDLATGAYLREIVSRFPADMMTRAFASTLAITKAGFTWPGPPMESFARWIYRPREVILGALERVGPLFVVAAIVGAAAYDLRIGLFLLFVLLYFGGYPAVQFAPRHFFHLELITWAAVGLSIQGVVSWRRPPAGSLRRVALLCLAIASVIASLGATRVYQTTRVRRLFDDYIAASKRPIPSDPAHRDANGFLRMSGPAKDFDLRLLEIDVNRVACHALANVGVQYDEKQPANNYSRQIAIAPSTERQPTRVFIPVYPPAFQGVRLPQGDGCVAGVYWVDPGRSPLLLETVLAPDWEHRPLYQRLRFEPAFGTP